MVPEYNQYNTDTRARNDSAGITFGSDYSAGPVNQPKKNSGPTYSFSPQAKMNEVTPSSYTQRLDARNAKVGSGVFAGDTSQPPPGVAPGAAATPGSGSYADRLAARNDRVGVDKYSSPFARSGASEQDQMLAEQNRIGEDPASLLSVFDRYLSGPNNASPSQYARPGATQQEELLAEQNRFAEDPTDAITSYARQESGGYQSPNSTPSGMIRRLDGSMTDYDSYTAERRARSPYEGPGSTSGFMSPTLGGGTLNLYGNRRSDAGSARSYQDRMSLRDRYMSPYSTGY